MIGDPRGFDVSGHAARFMCWLFREFTVIIVDEFNTSRKCSKCLRNIIIQDARNFFCPPCNLTLDRDICACLNDIWVFLFALATGERHPQFKVIR